MGAHLLHQDDQYSFQVITKTIDTVIPPLITVRTCPMEVWKCYTFCVTYVRKVSVSGYGVLWLVPIKFYVVNIFYPFMCS